MTKAGRGRQRVPTTKLAGPTSPSRLVRRPRLLAMLDRARDTQVTLLSAPAGAGKTMLLADWVRESGPESTAWVSLDSDDNDDNRFWSALLDALSTSTSVPDDSLLRKFAVPAKPSLDHGFLADVVDALDDLVEPIVLILDDVHELTDPQPLRGLEALLQHQPAGLRLVLSARHDPRLLLARLRLADELIEIRAEDLKFNAVEIGQLLAIEGIELDHRQLHQLLDQTEGWAAGLRLATQSMAQTTDPDRFLAEFAANDRAVAAYLIDEVLSRLPPEMSEFLRTISVCDYTPATLAARLSGRVDAAALLDATAEQTSLVFRADVAPHSYHVHALLRSHLLADLVRQDPERAAHLNGIAADWYATVGQPAQALTHAGRAGEATRITELLHRHAAELVLGGDHAVVRDALDVLGARRVAEDSRLALAAALLHLERGDPTGADRDLVHAGAAWPAAPNADLASLRQFVRARRAHVAGDMDELTLATTDLNAGAGIPDAAALLQRGHALLAANDRAAAREQLHAALAIAREGHHDYVVMQSLTALAGLAGIEGDYGLMITLAIAADDGIGRHGWQRTVEAATAAALLAYGALLRADSAECRRQAQRASQIVDAADPPAIPWLYLAAETLRGAAEFELGDRAGGVRRISAATGLAGGSADFTAPLVALCAMLEHRNALLLGWGTTAGAALRWAQSSITESAEVHLMQARAQLALGRREAAGKIIQPALDGHAPPVLAWTPIEVYLLSAELTLSAGDDASARRALDHALTIAARLDVLHPLVYATPEVIDLLTSRLGKLGGTTERFAERVFALRRALDVPPMVPLTARERAVLRLLPTLRSFDEIAEDLTVSANTVKTHVRAIYTKLGVTKRRDAVAVALERGLLEYEHRRPPDVPFIDDRPRRHHLG
jgi:LuxR family transcriptional regulator, maltose regulon positive regulatory protein